MYGKCQFSDRSGVFCIYAGADFSVIIVLQSREPKQKTNGSIKRKGVITMKKTNIKTKIIAGVLSAITVFSVGSVAMTSASAATTGNPYGDAAYQAGL